MEEIKQKKNNWKTISIILIVVILIASFYLGSVQLANKFKQEGYQLGIQDTAFAQTQQGIVYYINANQTIDSMQLNELCSRMVQNQGA